MIKLRTLLKNDQRVFWYDGKKHFAAAFLRKEFWPRGRFGVICCDHPNPGGYFELSSEILVKPIIRK